MIHEGAASVRPRRGAPRACVLLGLFASGCARDCAGSDAPREVLRHAGAGWSLVATCSVRTDVALLRRAPEPLLRGCVASATFTVRAATMSRDAALPGGGHHARDCREARRFCETLRVEVASRETPSGQVVGVAARGARDTALLAITDGGAVVRYPVDLSHAALPASVAHAPDLDALALRLARAGRLGPTGLEAWADELVPAFTPRFVRAHQDALVGLARACALRRVLVARLLAVDEVRDALARDPGDESCREVRAARTPAPPPPG